MKPVGARPRVGGAVLAHGFGPGGAGPYHGGVWALIPVGWVMGFGGRSWTWITLEASA